FVADAERNGQIFVFIVANRQEILAVFSGLGKQERAVNNDTGTRSKNELRLRIIRTQHAFGKRRENQRENYNGDQGNQRDGNRRRGNVLFVMFHSANEQTKPYNAVQNEHGGRINRIAGKRSCFLTFRHHKRNNDGNFNNRYGNGQNNGTVRFTYAFGNNFGMVYRRHYT